jgi:hypothetical protein
VVDRNRQTVPAWLPVDAKVSAQRAAAEDADKLAELKATEIAALLHDDPAGANDPVPATLAPYLSAPPGLSDEAYKEWLDRVCAQPADASD